MLDLALVVVRQWPLTLGLAALAGIAPFAAFNAWLLSDPEVPVGVLVYLLVLEAPWATAPLTVVLGGLMFGDRPSMGRVVRTLVRSFPSMFLFQFLARGFLMVTFFFYFLVPTRLAFLDEVILLERGKWWSAARRSAALCGQRGGELFGQWLAQLVFGGMVRALLLGGDWPAGPGPDQHRADLGRARVVRPSQDSGPIWASGSRSRSSGWRGS